MRRLTSTRLTRRITLVDHSQFSPFIHLSLSLGNISSLKGVPLKSLNLQSTNIAGASPHQHERRPLVVDSTSSTLSYCTYLPLGSKSKYCAFSY